MQPDGTLNPVADPAGAAQPVGLGRVLLAGAHDLGARRGLRGVPRRGGPGDPAFAAFLKDRLDLAVDALQRQTAGALRHLPADRRQAGAGLAGRRRCRRHRGGSARPVGVRRCGCTGCGAGRAGEAVRGRRPDEWRRRAQLAVRRGHALGALAVGVARLGLADAGCAGPGLRGAGRRLGRRTGGARLRDVRPVAAHVRRPGQRPAPHPDRPLADRLRRRLARSSRCSRRPTSPARPASVRLAGFAAAWYFGANASGQPAYDPATGRPSTASQADGSVNHNAGAESTIHALLSMLALDGHPAVAEHGPDRGDPRAGGLAHGGGRDRHADRRRAAPLLPGGPVSRSSAAPATSPSATARPRRSMSAAASGGWCMAVVDLQPGSTAVTTFRAGDTVLGAVRSGDVGAPGRLAGSWRAAARDAAGHPAGWSDDGDGDDGCHRRRRGPPRRADGRAAGVPAVLGGTGTAPRCCAARPPPSSSTTVAVPGSGPANGRGLRRPGAPGPPSRTSRRRAPCRYRVVAGGFTIVRR